MAYNNHEQNGASVLRALSNQDFLNFGIQNLAYIKPVHVDGRSMFAIHAADGTPLSVMKTEAEALITVRNNDLDPVIVH